MCRWTSTHLWSCFSPDVNSRVQLLRFWGVLSRTLVFRVSAEAPQSPGRRMCSFSGWCHCCSLTLFWWTCLLERSQRSAPGSQGGSPRPGAGAAGQRSPSGLSHKGTFILKLLLMESGRKESFRGCGHGHRHPPLSDCSVPWAEMGHCSSLFSILACL